MGPYLARPAGRTGRRQMIFPTGRAGRQMKGDFFNGPGKREMSFKTHEKSKTKNIARQFGPTNQQLIIIIIIIIIITECISQSSSSLLFS